MQSLQPTSIIEDVAGPSSAPVAAISSARRRCEEWTAAHNLSEAKQLRYIFQHKDAMQHNRLGLMLECDPPGLTPPCVWEGFLNLPTGFETALGAQGIHEERLLQCRLRKTDDAWPTIDPFARRVASTRTVADVMAVLGDRVVTIVGASTSLQLYEAVQCGLASAGLMDRAHQWKHWGWATFSADSGRCARR